MNSRNGPRVLAKEIHHETQDHHPDSDPRRHTWSHSAACECAKRPDPTRIVWSSMRKQRLLRELCRNALGRWLQNPDPIRSELVIGDRSRVPSRRLSSALPKRTRRRGLLCVRSSEDPLERIALSARSVLVDRFRRAHASASCSFDRDAEQWVSPCALSSKPTIVLAPVSALPMSPELWNNLLHSPGHSLPGVFHAVDR